MSDFYIPKDHSWELFPIFAENLFLIFWSIYSSFYIFSSENRPFKQQKNRGTHPGFSCLLYLIFYAALTSSH